MTTGCEKPIEYSNPPTQEVIKEESVQQLAVEPNSRKNPANVNETLIYNTMHEDFDAFKLEITLLEILRGGAALKTVKLADNYNDIPPNGKEYLLAKFKITALESKDDAPVMLDYMFGVVKPDGGAYADAYAWVSGIEEITSMYEGATQEAYVCFMVNTNDEPPLIVFPEYGSSRLWFSGRQTAGAEYDGYSPLGDPNRIGARSNPAKLGETATYNGIDLPVYSEAFNIDITVTEITRGRKALDMIISADSYNDKPPAGKEYLVAKVKVDAIASRDDAIRISDYDFKAFNGNGKEYKDKPYVWGFEGSTLSDMYPGASQEAYLFFLINESDSEPYIVAFSDSDIPVWFTAAQSDGVSSSSMAVYETKDTNVESWAIGCSAIYAIANGYDPFSFGMFVLNAENAEKARLSLRAGGVNNRNDLVDRIEHFSGGGDNSKFVNLYFLLSIMTEEAYEAMLQDEDEDTNRLIEFTMSLGDKWGQKQIKALDWFRVFHLAGWGYIAGYFDLDEAYSYMNPVAQQLKSTFTSWDDAVENYLDGIAWWTETDITDPDSQYQLFTGIYQIFMYSQTLFDPAVWK